MIKKLIKLLLVLLLLLTVIISYLSFFGIETTKFNNKIKDSIQGINKKINLELNSVKFLLQPSNLSINIKTLEPKIFINNNQLKLKYIKTNISLKSFINNKFSIDDLKISTKTIKLNNIIQLARSLKNSTELFILDKIVEDGFLLADIDLNFDSNGKIKNDYVINGQIKNGKLTLLNKNSINNLNLFFKIKKKEYILEDINTKYKKIKLSSPLIKIIEKKNIFIVNGKIITNKENINVELLKNIFNNSFKNFEIENLNFNSENDFIFNISKKFKISGLNFRSKINLNNIDYRNKLLNIKKYFPNFKKLVKLKNHQILVNYEKDKLDISGEGQFIIDDKIDKLNYKIIKKNDIYSFNTNLNINKNSLLIDILNYKKKENLNSLLKLDGIYKSNKEIKFNLISLRQNDNSFLVKNLSLKDKLKIVSIDLLDLDYINNDKILNRITLKRNKKNYKIKGKIFDANKLIEELLNNKKNNDDFSIFKNLNSNIDIKIDKTYLDDSTYLENLSSNIKFINNKIDMLKLDSKFSNNKELKITINTNNNERVTTLFSNYPKPLLKQYKFIKGFEEGVLDFYSMKKNGISNSVLIIDNFKVQEVPVLAKILTLASLQGIADLLTGEGIRFTDLEMRFSNEKKLMKIDEMYAIGPAISILMDGYIENEKLISLRGTLIPATTINRSIASIPLIGNILVGKKTGEGVFGVSFKIKGPPKELKTTVNPVKTLTPRFITRTLEKIKKN
jgi:hypothetical protein